jgi:enoyl-CoA hydratase/carnithine racemase
MTTDILSISHGAVAELRFNRPSKKNAITGAMYGALTAALSDAAADEGTRAVLISGEGDTFTAGNDIADFLAASGQEELPAVRFIHAIATFPKPLVAAVGGPAIGVGTTLLLHCDLVYAAPEARFAVPFVDLGLVPEAGSSMLLPMALGAHRANAMLLLGEAMDAEAAAAAGFVTLASAEALHAQALDAAMRLAAKPPAALVASRALIRCGTEAARAHMRLEEAAFATALAGVEAQKAFKAFLNRRAPS